MTSPDRRYCEGSTDPISAAGFLFADQLVDHPMHPDNAAVSGNRMGPRGRIAIDTLLLQLHRPDIFGVHRADQLDALLRHRRVPSMGHQFEKMRAALGLGRDALIEREAELPRSLRHCTFRAAGAGVGETNRIHEERW